MTVIVNEKSNAITIKLSTDRKIDAARSEDAVIRGRVGGRRVSMEQAHWQSGLAALAAGHGIVGASLGHRDGRYWPRVEDPWG